MVWPRDSALEYPSGLLPVAKIRCVHVREGLSFRWTVNPFSIFYSLTKADFNTELAGFREKALDDGGRRIGNGKHPAVGFCFEFNAAGLEPFDGVAGLESVERAKEFFFTAGIIFDELIGIEARMGNVAAASAGDFDFGKKHSSLF